MAEAETEEAEEVFEITDFSCQTSFERLCATIEQKLRAWMVDELSDSDEVTDRDCSAALDFQGRPYTLLYHGPPRPASGFDAQANFLHDLLAPAVLSAEAHPLRQYFGLSQFCLLRHEAGTLSEDLAHMLLGVLLTAGHHCDLRLPCFVTCGRDVDGLFLGRAAAATTCTYFRVEGSATVPPLCHDLDGLLDLFRLTIGLQLAVPETEMLISARHKYEISKWVKRDWIPRLAAVQRWDTWCPMAAPLRWGAERDPVLAFQLLAEWPSFAEVSLMERNVRRALDPLRPPRSHMHVIHRDVASYGGLLAERTCELVDLLLGVLYDEKERDGGTVERQFTAKLNQPASGATGFFYAVAEDVVSLASSDRTRVVDPDRCAQLVDEVFDELPESWPLPVKEEGGAAPRGVAGCPLGSLTGLLALQAARLRHRGSVMCLWKVFLKKLWSHVQERQPLPHVSVTDDLAGCPIGQVLQRVQGCLLSCVNSPGVKVPRQVQEMLAGLEQLPPEAVLHGLLRWWAAWVAQALGSAVDALHRLRRLHPVRQQLRELREACDHIFARHGPAAPEHYIELTRVLCETERLLSIALSFVLHLEHEDALAPPPAETVATSSGEEEAGPLWRALCRVLMTADLPSATLPLDAAEWAVLRGCLVHRTEEGTPVLREAAAREFVFQCAAGPPLPPLVSPAGPGRPPCAHRMYGKLGDGEFRLCTAVTRPL